MQESNGLSMEEMERQWRQNRSAHLGEEGTEQFAVNIDLPDGTSREQKCHDPFVTSRVTHTISRWSCLMALFKPDRARTVVTTLRLRGSHAAQVRIMTMNPYQMQIENAQWQADCKARQEAGGFLSGDSVMCAQVGTHGEDWSHHRNQAPGEV